MSKKLLLADDSVTIQKVIQIIFAHEDYELTVTDNGDSALEKAREIRPDLVMADVYMPGKNGYELTSAIKQDPALQHVPVLLLAGSFEPFDEDKARSCKADAWIEKPFESQTLIDKVAELLSAAREAPESPVPVAEPVAVVDVEESSPVALEETQEALPGPMNTGPEMAAAPEDPFGDISFEEETPAVEPAPVEDWSDVVVESPVAESVVEDTFAVAEEPVTESSGSVAADFAIKEAPVEETDFDVFEMGDDEIMPLGDDDILGEEDLELVLPEQTLAAWSRDDTADEDIFSEPLEEVPAVEAEPVFVPPVEPPALEEEFAAVDPVAEETPVFGEPVEETPPGFEEPAADSVPDEESSIDIEEPGPVVLPVAVAAVETKVSALSEEDVEQLIEKVVTKVVEKLAGSILERVAWEVVPDLAENLIREEIRKIKDAVA
jgi:CheY-like chemotaxis protein